MPDSVWNAEIRVHPYETDINNRWKPTAIFQAFQEAANSHAANLGFDYHSLLEKGHIWVLSRLKVYFYRFPAMGDSLTIRTWPKGIRQKIFFTRDFQISAPDGSLHLAATSAWLLIDPVHHRMQLPSSLDGELPLNPGLNALEEDLMKIAPENGLTEKFTATAGYSMVDLLGHVNNARYIDWVLDCFDFEQFKTHHLAWLQINYNNEVRAGETVRLLAGPRAADPSRWLVVGEKSASGERAFEVELAWTFHEST